MGRVVYSSGPPPAGRWIVICPVDGVTFRNWSKAPHRKIGEPPGFAVEQAGIKERRTVSFYESVYIARPDISSAQVEALTQRLTEIVETNGGKVTKNEYWGLKNLAYRIKKNRKGHYSLLNIDAPSAALSELERNMRLSEDILRYLTVKVDALDENPSVMMARGGRDDRGRDRDRGRGGFGGRGRDRDDGPRRTEGAEGEERKPRDGEGEQTAAPAATDEQTAAPAVPDEQTAAPAATDEQTAAPAATDKETGE